jgi:hypothetical protein
MVGREDLAKKYADFIRAKCDALEEMFKTKGKPRGSFDK